MGVTLNSKEVKGKVSTTGLIATVGLVGSRGAKGEDGEDGFSPIITTSKSGKVTTITITDATGTKTATINDGEDGQGSGEWGSITGTLSDQTDLNAALSGKQEALVSGTNIKTINNQSILGSGNISVGGGSGGTSDYDELENRPQINSVTLTGNKSLSDLGINIPTRPETITIINNSIYAQTLSNGLYLISKTGEINFLMDATDTSSVIAVASKGDIVSIYKNSDSSLACWATIYYKDPEQLDGHSENHEYLDTEYEYAETCLSSGVLYLKSDSTGSFTIKDSLALESEMNHGTYDIQTNKASMGLRYSNNYASKTASIGIAPMTYTQDFYNFSTQAFIKTITIPKGTSVIGTTNDIVEHRLDYMLFILPDLTVLKAKANVSKLYLIEETSLVKMSDVTTALSNYYTKAETDTELATKVDKVTGKQLSTEDYTSAEKNKLAGIEAGAEVNPNVVNTKTSSTDDVYCCTYINDKIMKSLPTATNIDSVLETGTYSIFHATGTLPTGYAQADNNFILEVKASSNGRIQILHDCESNESFRRYDTALSQIVWSSWEALTSTDLIMVDTDTPTQDTKLYIESTDIDGQYEVIEDEYSTSEIKTNKVWTNGKPIYRRVLSGTITGTGEWKTINDSILTNAQAITKLEGIASGYLPIPSYVNSSYSVALQYATGVGVQVYLNGFPEIVATVIVEYTKTTD